MERLCLLEGKDSLFLLKVEVLDVRRVDEVQSVGSHVVREEEQRHEYSILNVTQSAA